MKNKLRVAAIIITPPSFKASGGVSAGLQLMKHVAKTCETHLLLMSDHTESAIEDSLNIDRIPAYNAAAAFAKFVPRQIITLLWRAKFADWLDKHKPDIVHFHNPNPPGALAQAANACWVRNIPYVISTHGFIEFNDYATAFGSPGWQRPILDVLVRRPLVRVARQAAKVLMLSPQEEPVVTSMGVPKIRQGVVPNGVDPYYLEVIPKQQKEALVQRFSLPNNKKRIFFVGNHTTNKGIDTLLKAVSIMQEPAVAIIAGGIRSQEEHHAMLQQSGYDPASNKAIFTDFTSLEELRALYQSADIFAFPSRADTLPLVILEAMVSRLPVVSTRIGGIPYEVTSDTGILIQPGDAQALADSLDVLCKDALLCKRMGDAGYARAMDLFDWSRSAELSLQTYEEITGLSR
jgi:alpha-maltose-1-phosphate synthase